MNPLNPYIFAFVYSTTLFVICTAIDHIKKRPDPQINMAFAFVAFTSSCATSLILHHG